MKFLFDFFPVLLFFVAYKMYDIYIATGVAIMATVAQVALFWLKHRRFERMHLFTLALISVFGGATILLHDEAFIKWKPTILDWLFATAFIGSQIFGKKPLIRRMLESNLALPDQIWLRLNWSWAIFFFLLGAANVYVIYNFDTDTWVNFKLFGMMGLTIAFVIGQAFYLARYMDPESSQADSK